MNIKDQDYKDFIEAYNGLPVVLRVGKYNVRDLNDLPESDIFDEILLSLTDSLRDSFYASEDENSVDSDLFASVRMEMELYKGLSEAEKYVAAINDLVEINLPRFKCFYNSRDFSLSIYFYYNQDEYVTALDLLGKMPTVSDSEILNKSMIILNSGRIIYLEELFQYYTYRGLLEGAPNKKLNSYLIEQSFKYAKEKLLFNVEPILIPPQITSIDLSSDKMYFRREDFENEAEEMPKIVCLSSWNCYSPAQHKDYEGSFLKIIWFQNNFALPIDNLVAKQIKSIDWDKYAIDYGSD